MIFKYLNIFLKLVRIYLSLAVSFSAFTGYVLCCHTIDLKSIYLLSGVFLLAGAVSALNHFQERKTDAIMDRTKNRPLPLKQIEPATVVVISIIMTAAASCFLYFGTTVIAFALGIFNLVWYNGIYTPLKKKTPFAVVIGALTGALPPVIGWTAAGGNIDSRIIIVALFMFIWQIPHFWLLLMKYGSEYEMAGFATILRVFSTKSMKRVVFAWIVSSSICSFSFPLYHIISGSLLIDILIVINVFLILFFARSLFSKSGFPDYPVSFHIIYFYQVLILVLIIIDALKQ